MGIKTSQCVRALPETGGSVEAFVRTMEVGSRTCLAMANAAVSGFERMSPRLSARMLDAVENVFAREGGGDVEAIQTAMLREASTVIPTAHGQDDGAAGWLSLAIVEEGSVNVLWVGADEVQLIPKQGDGDRTAGHTSGRESRSAGVVPDILTHGLGTGYEGALSRPSKRTWTVAPGDLIIMLNRYLARMVTSKQVIEHAALASMEALPQELSQIHQIDVNNPFFAVLACKVS